MTSPTFDPLREKYGDGFDDFIKSKVVPVNGGAPKQLTNFTSDQIAWLDLSRDGKPTLFSHGAATKDVVRISGFRK